MATPPAPDPGTALALKAAQAALTHAPKAVTWTVEQVEAQQEMAWLLRSGIARAICPDATEHEGAQALADRIYKRLAEVDFPNPRAPGRVKRTAQRALTAVTGKRYRPSTTNLSVVGGDYFDLLAAWVERALDADDTAGAALRKDLAKVRCGGTAPEPEQVLRRFPAEIAELVYTKCTSAFCDGLKLMLAERNRRRVADEKTLRDERLKRWLRSLGTGATGYAVLDAAWLDTPQAAAIGALAALGVAGVHEIKRQRQLRGLRYEALRTITEILQAAKPEEGGHGSWRPVTANLRRDLKDLTTDPRAAEDPALVDVVSELEYALRYWERNLDDESARKHVGMALNDAVALLKDDGTPRPEEPAARPHPRPAPG